MQKRLLNKFFKIRNRCQNPYNVSFPKYGGRGIGVCQEWLEDRDAFISWAMSNGYRPGLHLHRIDNNKGYSPDNCIFITAREHKAYHSNKKDMNRGMACPIKQDERPEWPAPKGWKGIRGR